VNEPRAVTAPVGRALRLLLVEDSHEHARLAALWIAEEGHGRFAVTWVERLSTALSALDEGDFDVILLDLSLPDSDRIETFRAIRARAPVSPIVLMTGIGDERLALQAVQEGAQDYLVKGDIDGRLLVRALDYAMERKRADEAERRLLEAQRLESLAVVAGGVAHQLNNLLVVILGNATLAATELPRDNPIRQYLVEIESASERAAKLARQMLAYSGRGGFVRRPLDLREAVRATCDALERELPVGLRLELSMPDAVVVTADESQIAQLVHNLVNNAVEASPARPSVVAVRLARVAAMADDFARAYLSPSLPEGEYARLEVQDHGTGMAAAVAARMFEPFFTTRLTGRGLGLPAALGIVRGHGGAIAVDSAPGVGTTVTVWLPTAVSS
jgi:signal transduction histidine kinase